MPGEFVEGESPAPHGTRQKEVMMMLLAPAHAACPAPSSCSSNSCSCRNAAVFHKINALLGNNLNLSGLCRCRDEAREKPAGPSQQTSPLGASSAGPWRRQDVAQATEHGSASGTARGNGKKSPSSWRAAKRDGEPEEVEKLAAGKSATDSCSKIGVAPANRALLRLETKSQACAGLTDCRIEKEALLQRKNAVVRDAKCTWSGKLPKRCHQNPTYSCKVFMGGVPWDITEAGILSSMKNFGALTVEWPVRDGKHPNSRKESFPKGYLYVLFEQERSIRALLQACKINYNTAFGSNMYYYEVSSRKMKSKVVQVIPWVVSDSNYTCYPSLRLDSHKTVFVGALHGMLNAEGLAAIMDDLFGGVVYAGIDTDKYKYPIGSGRVTFNNPTSYMSAVTAAIVEIKTTKFTKKIQIDPYLEDCTCHLCNNSPGNFFCRDTVCFTYYCRDCWQVRHSAEQRSAHRPLMKNQRGKTML